MDKESLVSKLTDKQVDKLLEYTIKFSDENLTNIKMRTLKQVHQKERKTPMKKWFMGMAATIILLVTSTAVFAAVTDFDFGQIFNSFFNNQSANVMDVGKTLEQGGIEITLTYAYSDGNQVYAMLEIRDLLDNRLSDDMDLVFSNTEYHAHIFTPIMYDEESGLIKMGIRVDMWGRPELIISDELSFVVDAVLSGILAESTTDFLIYDYLAPRDMLSRSTWVRNASDGQEGGATSVHAELEQEPIVFLALGDMNIYMDGISWAVITNIGVVNDMVHIQTKQTDEWNMNYNFGSLLLIDADGNMIFPVFGLSAGDYNELVFDIAGYSADELRIASVGRVANEILYGPWNFSFPINTQPARVSLEVELSSTEKFTHADIDISSMTTRVTFYGEDTVVDMDSLRRMNDYIIDGEHLLTLICGRAVELFFESLSSGSGISEIRFNSLYFDISELRSITIFGEEFKP